MLELTILELEYNPMQNHQQPQKQEHPQPEQQLINIQTKTEMNIPKPAQHTSSPLAQSLQALRTELLSMQFEQDLIDIALQTSTTLEQAIQTIITLLQSQDQQLSPSEPQLLLLVRMDLKMGTGKIAAQCAHATLRAFQSGRHKAEADIDYAGSFIHWLEAGKKMAYFKVEDQQQFFALLKECQQAGLPNTYIRDAGRTQIAAGSATVGAIGPIAMHLAPSSIRALKPL